MVKVKQPGHHAWLATFVCGRMVGDELVAIDVYGPHQPGRRADRRKAPLGRTLPPHQIFRVAQTVRGEARHR